MTQKEIPDLQTGGRAININNANDEDDDDDGNGNNGQEKVEEN